MTENRREAPRARLSRACPLSSPRSAESLLEQLEAGGYTDLVRAIRRLWAGERDPAALCLDLDEEDTTFMR